MTTTPVTAVANVLADAAPAAVNAAAPAAAVGAANAAGQAAPVLVAATHGVSGAGWLGYGAGAAGLVITLLDQWKQATGSGKGFDAGGLLSPTTMAIGGGAFLLTAGEKLGASPLMKNGLRSAGIALVLGGLAGAIAGAMKTFGNPLLARTEAGTSSQSQAPTRFGTALPPAPANLEGIELAQADVIGEGRKVSHVSVYVDPTTAKVMPTGSTLGEAIGQARAATQADADDRSHAVIQTKDGAYWIMRLSGDLDQVDGRKYSDTTKYDRRYEPQIGRRQEALQAIAGVEGYYVFPKGTEATAKVQYTGDIPWVTPQLPGTPAATPTTTPSTAPSTAPATTAPATTATGTGH
jgi:hypothetical protein